MIRIIGLLGSAVLIATTAAAQYWPKPASTPGVDVPCTGCVSPQGANGKLTPGYPATITTFTGRFLDSQATQDYQQAFRTGRAFYVLPAPSRNRIYMIIGSALFAYDINTFFSRVVTEPLVAANAIPVQGTFPHTPWEIFLRDDEFFYAENEPTGWQIQHVDGQERLYGMDYDDRGNVYLAYTMYGWGIVKDDGSDNGSLMLSEYQYPYWNSVPDDVYPEIIASVKGSSGHYYALISDGGVRTNVFDVTDPTNPMRLQSLNQGMVNFAKTAAGDRIAIATGTRQLQIYSSDGVASGTPLVTFSGVSGGPIRGIACDGTNFYATSDTSSGLVISVFAPSGNTYARVGDYPQGSDITTTIKLSYGDGYLTRADGGNLRVFKLQNGVPVEIQFGDYFKHYYTSPATPTYVAPSFHFFWDSTVIKKNNHTYLVATAYSLGDVYELPSADSVTANVGPVVGNANPNVPAGAGSGPFPGDQVSFNSTTGAPAPMNVNWNFGDGSAVVPSLTGTSLTHQFAGTVIGSSPSAPVNVTVTNATDSSITSSVPVTIYRPTQRFGIANTKFLFVQPDASSPAPIIQGDSFDDASDGTLQSHYDSWTIDSTTSPLAPPSGPSAGLCGTHSMSVVANYGPYSAPGSPSGTPLALSISPFNYNVRPFAAAAVIDVPAGTASTITFSSVSRVSTDPNAISASQAAALTYKWELLGPTGSLITSQNGAAPGGAVPQFTVNKPIASGSQAHLVLTAPSGVGSGCAAYTTADAYTPPLNPPAVASITANCTGGTNTTPCTFSVVPVTGADTTGWTYLWSASSNAATINPLSSTAATYQPTITNPGTSNATVNVSVTVSNSIGSASPAAVTVTALGAPACDPMNASDIFISYRGASSGCTQSGSTQCTPGENVTLQVSTYPPYSISCAPHTFSWSFGGTTQSVTHQFTSTTSVSVVINNGAQSYTANATVSVGSGNPNPGGGSCQTMNSSDIFISYVGAQSGCTSSPTSVPCIANETVNLSIQPFSPYSLTCANHTYNWSFGGSAQYVSHQFASTTPISCTINNGTQVYTATTTVTVGSGGNPGGGSCQTMNASDVFISWVGAQSGCTVSPTSVPCVAGEKINLTVSAFPPYSFSCASHTFNWSFGGTGQNVQQTFNTTTQISVIINNGSQSYTATATIPIGSGGSSACQTMNAQDVFISYTGTQSGCTTSPTSVPCNSGEPVNLTVSAFPPYQFSCASHTFTWSFGGTGQNITHAFNATTPISVLINNGSQTYIASATITVAPPPGPFDYDFNITAVPSFANTYSFNAFSTSGSASALANVTFVWNFGDGTPPYSTTLNPVLHQYLDSTNYTITLTVQGTQGSVQHKVDDRFRHRPSTPP